MADHAGTRLLLPEDVVFTCQHSGACCRNDWLIGVDEGSHRRLRDVEFVPGEKFRPLPVPLATGETVTFARTPGGACVFLTPDARCAIHRHLGYRDKPQVCREFPYAFVETPDGVAVGVSFACTAVRAHHGRSLPEQTAEILAVLEGSRRVRQLPDPLALYAGLEIAWEEYRAIENALLAVFAQPDVPFPRALLAGSVLLSLLVGLKRVEDRARREGRVPSETLGTALETLRREDYRRILAIAASASYPRRPSLAYLAPLYTWLELSRYRLSRVGLVVRLYANALKFRRGRGAVRDVITGAPAEIAAVARVRFEATGAEVDGFLREYWSHVLFRKTLTPMHGVFRGYQTLLALYGFTKWMAKLHAARRGRGETDLDDVKEAVRLVEQRLILHADFARLFDLSPFLTVMADRLYRRPAFVRAAVLEPADVVLR